MRKTFLIVAIVFSVVSMYAQVKGARQFVISADGVVSGPIFFDDGYLTNSIGVKISKEQGRYYFSPSVYQRFLSAYRNRKSATVLNSIGSCFAGCAIGSTLGYIIGGGDVSDILPVAGIIAGCSIPFFAIGIPLSAKSKRELLMIADEYNAGNGTHAYCPRIEVGVTGSCGVGLMLSF